MKKLILLSLSCAALALAQNPNTAAFSTSTAIAPTDHDLGVATFRATSTLAADITSSSTSLTVATGEGSRFKAGNFIVIGSEVIAVYSVSSDTLSIGKSASGNVDGRGLDGTTAAAHLTGVAVSNFNAPSYVNQAAAELKALAAHNLKLMYRSCVIENDSQSATVLTDAQITGRCDIPKASTLMEIAVYASGGTPSVTMERFRPVGATAADLQSGALATGSSGAYACAMASTSATCLSGTTSSGSVTLSNTSLNAGDVIRVKTATAGGTATWHHIVVFYKVL